MNDELSQMLIEHMGQMRRCNSQADAVTWMARAYNLMEECLREFERPKVFQVPGSYGEKFYTITAPESIDIPPPPRIITAHAGWFNAETVVYGDKYQNRAWTKKDTRALEKENARRAAEQFTKGVPKRRQYGRA